MDVLLRSKKLLKFIFVFVFLIFIIRNNNFILIAKSINELKSEQTRIKKNSLETHDNLDQTRFDKANALQEVNLIDRNIELAEKELSTNEEKLINNKKKLEQAKLDLETANKKKLEHEITYKKHLRFVYENGKNYYIKIILDANDLHDLLRRKDYVNAIIKYDTELLNNYYENQIEINKKIKEINQDEIKIKKLINNQESHKSNLKNQIKLKTEYINKINIDLKKYQQELDKLDEMNKKITELILLEQEKIKNKDEINKNKNTLIFNNGKFGWPVYDFINISSDYGYRNHPINNKREFHSGIDIPAPFGTPVHASEGGVIISCCVLGGYGNTIIIRHDDNLCTLYAHNSKLLSKLGQTVKRGDIISLVGSTGVSTAPHCHFEVRLNGSHVDPKKYLNINKE